MSRCPIRSTTRARRRAICSASTDRPTAVVCGNDVIAYGVLLEAERSGFSVPRDLSVVGFDDLDWSRHLRPSLTTIHVPTGETWQRAGEYLVRQLAGEQTIMHHEIDYSLVVRELTAPPTAFETERIIPMNAHFLAAPGFHAVVIGGAGDIGAAITNLFCDLGATVTATGVNDDDLARTPLKPRPGLDARRRSTSPTTRPSRPSRSGTSGVDALINCAGILARDKEYEIETFMKVLDVNLTGTFRTCMAFRPAAGEDQRARSSTSPR